METEQPDEEEELPQEPDFADPLKRDTDESLPGLDPITTLPPED